MIIDEREKRSWLGNGSGALGAILTRTYAKMPKCWLRCKMELTTTWPRSLGHHWCGNTSRMKSQKVRKFQIFFCMQQLWLGMPAIGWVISGFENKAQGPMFWVSFNNAPVIVGSLEASFWKKKMTKDWRAYRWRKSFFDTLARKFQWKWGEEVGNGFKLDNFL